MEQQQYRDITLLVSSYIKGEDDYFHLYGNSEFEVGPFEDEEIERYGLHPRLMWQSFVDSQRIGDITCVSVDALYEHQDIFSPFLPHLYEMGKDKLLALTFPLCMEIRLREDGTIIKFLIYNHTEESLKYLAEVIVHMYKTGKVQVLSESENLVVSLIDDSGDIVDRISGFFPFDFPVEIDIIEVIYED